MTEENTAPGGEAVTDEAAVAAAAAAIETPEGPETPEAVEATPEQKADEERQKQAEKTKRRINSEVGRRKQAEAAARKAELEAAELRGRVSAQPKPAEAEPPIPGKQDDYENADLWLAAHKARDRFETQKQTEAQQAESTRRAEENARRTTESEKTRTLGQQFGEREADARVKYDDYDEVIDNSTAIWNESMREAAMRLANGPDVVYHLSQKPDEANRIALLDPVSAATELGAIGARLTTVKPAPKATSAPDPVTPVGNGGDAPAKDPTKMTNEEYRVSRGYKAKVR